MNANKKVKSGKTKTIISILDRNTYRQSKEEKKDEKKGIIMLTIELGSANRMS